MSFTFNISKGQTVGYHEWVNNNTTANSALILVVLAEAGIESEDVLQDYDTLAALLAGSSNEVTNTGYARKVLTDADLTPATVDDTNNWVVVTFATQTWATISAGDSWRMLLVCFDSDTTAGTDANVVPMYGIDMFIDGAATIPNGDDIVVNVPNGYAIAR